MKTSNFNNSESKNNQVFNSRKEQYEAIKYGRPWYLLLFYWGAHYAAYDKDAETVAEVLDGMDGVTTYEECGMKCTVFPVDALAEALPKLRARNEYISICDNLSHNGLYSRRTLADILNRNKTGRYYGECTDVFTSSDDREQADVKAEGCEVVRHIYYRIDCPDYEAGHDIDAFYSEVVKLLEAEGWHVEGDWQGAHCPTMRKGAQSLYCHPQSLSGEVSPVECDRIGQVLMTGKTFLLRGIDDYGRIFLTASEEQERDLYRQNYQDGLSDVLREVLTTKRSNLYRDKGDALGNAYRRTAIENIRTDMEDKGSNYYYWRKAVTEFVDSEYDRLLQAGYIKEATGQNGRTLCRWINKKEEKELTKARREAEKAEKERKDQEWQEFLDREAEKQNSFAEGMRVTVPACSLTDGETFVIVTIRRKAADNGGNASLTVKNETTGDVRNINGSDVQDILPPLEPASEITEAEGIKVGDRVWCKHGKVMGTVTAIRIWNPDYAFKVRLDKPVTLFGRTFEETEFRRAGITKNYDHDGMIVGNAQYYAEQLKYGPASIIEYELAGVALRTESTREDVEPDSREGWGNEYRVTIHHQTGDTTETMTLSETAELLARMYQEEQGEAA